MKIQRILLLLFYLMRKGIASTKELVEYLEVSKRTVYRDIEELRTAGVDISSTPGLRGGHRLSGEFKLDSLLFNSKELVSILFSSKVLSQFENTEFAQEAKALEKKLEGVYGRPVWDASSKMLIDWQYAFHGEEYQRKLALIEKAVNGNEIVYIRYESPLCDRMSTSGYAEPYGLINKVGYWYLAAYCQELETFRAMNISYMSNILLTGKKFVRKADFSLSEFWKRQKSR